MASLIQQDGLYSLQFYKADRSPKRKRVPLRVRVKRDAETIRRKLERDYSVGTFDPWTDDPLAYDRKPLKPEGIAEASEAFFDAKSHKASLTLKDYRKVISRFVLHVGPSTPVGRVTAKDVEEWLDSTEAKDVTRHAYCRNLKVFFRWARKEGLTDVVATENVRLRKLPRKYPRFLTHAEVERFAITVRREARSVQWLADLVVFACHTGLRRSELVNLRWDAVDLDSGMLTVANTESFRTKSGADRKVPLSETAKAVLGRVEAAPNCEYVFTCSNGKISPDYLSQAFKKYATKAGLKGVHLHHTRHTACSWLAQRGVPIEAIRRFAGHSTITVTERYMHLSDSMFSSSIRKALA
ncbi:tyrosine-type recombinase/integrase [Rubricoccus marinus]|uniref:Tyr recombinase domain-containing protein n=1 Tax=Rubricoccus marinus TaxID=716817 RepID=A0A259TYJ2_9BACT|nr:hypothetical protein BSZ36_07585 [Rubricoccus marinus]